MAPFHVGGFDSNGNGRIDMHESYMHMQAMGGGSGSGGGSGGGCYVATAVYGSYDCPEVWVLRRFRDHTLAQSALGRAFIRAYYAVSPALVRRFGGAGWFRGLCKPPLQALVRRLRAHGVEDTPYADAHWQ